MRRSRSPWWIASKPVSEDWVKRVVDEICDRYCIRP